MNERAIHIGLLVSALALAGWVFASHARSTRPATPTAESSAATSPLALIPPGSAFVLSADIAQLRHAVLGPILAARLGSSAGDLGGLCGFDPLTALDQLALAVPSAGAAAGPHQGDFGVIATGHFSAPQITRCASASIMKRGGDPVSSKLGAFSSVRDRAGAGGEVAARDGGPLIISGGSYFRELLDAANGKGRKLEHEDPRDAHHAALRRMLGPGTIVATWLLSEGWFERVSGDSSARLSPLGGLKAIGARLDVSHELRVSILLECADSAGVNELEALLEQLRSSLSALALDPTLRGLAQRIRPQRDGARLRLDLTLADTELLLLLDAAFGPSAPAPGGTSLPPAGASSADMPQIRAH
ncbi:MAG TPA: hypothetical protein VGM29_17255 [Polyangiaceae bacterium]